MQDLLNDKTNSHPISKDNKDPIQSPRIERTNTNASSTESYTTTSNHTNINDINDHILEKRSPLEQYYNSSHFNCLYEQYKPSFNLCLSHSFNYLPKNHCNSQTKLVITDEILQKPFIPLSLKLKQRQDSQQSDQLSTDHLKRKGWVCLNCSNFNYERRKQCNKCKEEKIIKSIDQIQYRTIEKKSHIIRDNQSSSSSSSVKKTDWKCAHCCNINYSFRTICNCCHLTREASDQMLMTQRSYYPPMTMTMTMMR